MACTDPSHLFLVADAKPMEGRMRRANDEVDALRQLVRDIVADAIPALSTMRADIWPEGDWRRRAQRAIAGCPIAEVQP